MKLLMVDSDGAVIQEYEGVTAKVDGTDIECHALLVRIPGEGENVNTENEIHELVPVEDLKVGDYVDLEKDPYADPWATRELTIIEQLGHDYESDHMYYECEYAVVASEPEIDPEDEHAQGVRVEFDVTTVFFPAEHKVRRYKRDS